MKRILKILTFPVLYFCIVCFVTIGFDWLIKNVDLVILAKIFKFYLAVSLGIFLGMMKNHIDSKGE